MSTVSLRWIWGAVVGAVLIALSLLAVFSDSLGVSDTISHHIVEVPKVSSSSSIRIDQQKPGYVVIRGCADCEVQVSAGAQPWIAFALVLVLLLIVVLGIVLIRVLLFKHSKMCGRTQRIEIRTHPNGTSDVTAFFEDIKVTNKSGEVAVPFALTFGGLIPSVGAPVQISGLTVTSVDNPSVHFSPAPAAVTNGYDGFIRFGARETGPVSFTVRYSLLGAFEFTGAAFEQRWPGKTEDNWEWVARCDLDKAEIIFEWPVAMNYSDPYAMTREHDGAPESRIDSGFAVNNRTWRLVMHGVPTGKYVRFCWKLS